eukprot:29134-Pelagococcus_subviridis.AAC.1
MYIEYDAAPKSAMTSPTLRPTAAEVAASATAPPPSNPRRTTPTMASAHPAHVTLATFSPSMDTKTGVNAIEACVRKLTRVASVNSSAMLHAPCAARFQNASSTAASQKLFPPIHFFSPPCVLAPAPAAAALRLLSFSSIGTKHSAANTPRTAPIVPADGGPGSPYTYLNATDSVPYAAATNRSSPRPYHTPLTSPSVDAVADDASGALSASASD